MLRHSQPVMQVSYNGRFVCVRPLWEFELKRDQHPQARSGHACVADESNLYLYGGFNNRLGKREDESKVFSELWVYNFSTFTWRTVQTLGLPKTAASAALRLWDKKLFLYGGTGYPFGSEMCNSLHVCHIDTNFRWEEVDISPNISTEDSVESPLKAYGQSITCHQGDIYVFGGAVGLYIDPINDLYRLSFSDRLPVWEKLNSARNQPTGRYKAEVVAHPSQERFYVIGGGNLWGSQSLDKLDTYEFSTNTWSVVDTQPDRESCEFPKGRAAFGCVQRNNVVIISGGRHYDIDNSEALDDVWVLDLLTLQWNKLNLKLPMTLFFHAMALSNNGRLYVFGGVHKDARQGDLYEVQVFMPKLSELCWKVFTQCFNDVRFLQPDKLLEKGVPLEFITRLPKLDLKRLSISCQPS